MPPKARTFKTPDGQEFTDRSEWRKYMMDTFYSFKNKKGSPFPDAKMPGTIDGQMFVIEDCEDTELVVMDHCEQVQIDNVKNSKIFIGACESSIFIRNCENCTFYVACRQLRLREVKNSTFYSFSTDMCFSLTDEMSSFVHTLDRIFLYRGQVMNPRNPVESMESFRVDNTNFT